MPNSYLGAAVLALLLAAPAAALPPAKLPSPTVEQTTRIVAVVNGDVISNSDVNNRARLFAVSTGLPLNQDVIDRLKQQITRQLIDERLRMQEVQRLKVVVPDKSIADAIKGIETRNGLPPGGLRAKLAADGVSQTTLIDQIRTQLGWGEVLRGELGDKLKVTDAEVAEQQRLLAQQVGKPEYRVGEIFIPVEDPAAAADAQRFAETVITELRAGAAFPVVAAQFSQNQTALQGGELGWVQPNQLDRAVAQLVAEMPVGAISNPVRVPGGFSIVTVQGKRQIGSDMTTALTLRQTFLSFTSALNPQAPTEQQKQTLEKARTISSTVHSCDAMEQAAKTYGSARPADPGDVRLDSINPPALRQQLANQPLDKATEPLVTNDGIAVLIVCSRGEKNMAQASKEEVRQQLLSERIELLSRQLQADLRRHASIEIRSRGS
ncbi:MAG TPA: peptidylprolyl isomerase [Acetobacteraceae bacterium]|jgi:peptidyl-prolyl cis-trans isomerase SurA|nr:peptidylprolyl isomerase [Acetobacteraceae bacterium]